MHIDNLETPWVSARFVFACARMMALAANTAQAAGMERGFHPPIQHGSTWFFTISNHGYIGDVLIKQGEVALLVG